MTMHHQTTKHISRLKDIIATQKQVIGKRNDMFSKLRNRMYDAKLMFYFMQAFRELEEKWFNSDHYYKDGKLEVADFFILLYANGQSDFWATDAQEVINAIPERLKHRRYIAESCLKRLNKLDLVRYFIPSVRERKWFITPAGKWFLMERTRDMRRIVIDCLMMESKPRRRLIKGGKKI